jgi:hypothetical protein
VTGIASAQVAVAGVAVKRPSRIACGTWRIINLR